MVSSHLLVQLREESLQLGQTDAGQILGRVRVAPAVVLDLRGDLHLLLRDVLEVGCAARLSRRVQLAVDLSLGLLLRALLARHQLTDDSALARGRDHERHVPRVLQPQEIGDLLLRTVVALDHVPRKLLPEEPLAELAAAVRAGQMDVEGVAMGVHVLLRRTVLDALLARVDGPAVRRLVALVVRLRLALLHNRRRRLALLHNRLPPRERSEVPVPVTTHVESDRVARGP